MFFIVFLSSALQFIVFVQVFLTFCTFVQSNIAIAQNSIKTKKNHHFRLYAPHICVHVFFNTVESVAMFIEHALTPEFEDTLTPRASP